MIKNWLRFSLTIAAIAGCWMWHQPHPQYAKVTLQSQLHSTIPALEVNIESRPYLLALDTGAEGSLFLREEILAALQNKEMAQPIRSMDIHGNQYEKACYIIPQIKIANLQIRPVSVIQESEEFLINASIGNTSANISQERAKHMLGRLGMHCFAKGVLYIDLPHSELYIAQSTRILQEQASRSLSGFTQIALSPNSAHPIFLIKTDHGTKQILIDTGMELSLWHDSDASRQYRYVPIQLDLTEPTSHTFIAYNLASLSVDAILGVDFLKKHVVCFDLPNNHAFISPQMCDTPPVKEAA